MKENNLAVLENGRQHWSDMFRNVNTKSVSRFLQSVAVAFNRNCSGLGIHFHLVSDRMDGCSSLLAFTEEEDCYRLPIRLVSLKCCIRMIFANVVQRRKI